jgi:hypothetical protein
MMIGLNSLSVDTKETGPSEKESKPKTNDLIGTEPVSATNGKVCVSVDDLLTSDLGEDAIQASGNWLRQ